MKQTVKIIVVILILMEGVFIHLTFKSFSMGNDNIEQVSYENNIDTKKTISYLIGDENGGYTEATDRTTWPNKNEYKYIKSICYDGDGNEIKASEVITFDNSENKTMVNTATTLYCYMYFLPTSLMISPSELTSPNLETAEQLATRNETIGNVQDDLRRFVGTYSQVTDNFICFGTLDQQECKGNMDLYMYRIIGVDTEGRLKLIKATKLVQGSSTNTFQWHNSPSSNTTWQNADLYKRLNGTSSESTYPNIFIGNEKYPYMQEEKWTNLIDTPTYYIGDSGSGGHVVPAAFQNERTKSIDNAKIGLMYLSDYLYANKGTADTNNWLFIQNGLNGTTNTPTGSIAPTHDQEWTMTRYGAKTNYAAWSMDMGGVVNTLTALAGKFAVRPVFYLDSGVSIRPGGEGSIGNPYVVLG